MPVREKVHATLHGLCGVRAPNWDIPAETKWVGTRAESTSTSAWP